jgi:hypothetical protein
MSRAVTHRDGSPLCLVLLLLCLFEALDVGVEDVLCFCGAETLVVQD